MFALSISHHGVTKHYRIDKRRTSTGEKLAIESGPQFDNLMDVSLNSRSGTVAKLLLSATSSVDDYVFSFVCLYVCVCVLPYFISKISQN